VDTTADHARRLDAADPLRHFRDRFEIRDPGTVYFDGNSLGRLPTATVARLREVVEQEWGGELVRGWDHWVTLPLDVGDRLGAAVLGAAAGQVAVCDSTTVNLYKLATAALDARPDRAAIAIDEADFPTDRYVLQGLARARGLETRPANDGPDPSVALVVRSMVDYRTAAMADVPAVTEAARRAGTLVLWDLSHAAGAVEVDLDGWGVDLAVGCTYKYLCAGPGSPAWLYVSARCRDLRPPIWGWFANDDQWRMGPTFSPAPGIRRWLTGTPPVPALAAVDCGVALLAEAGMARVRQKSVALTSYAIDLADAWLAPLGFEVASPRDPTARGGHVALRHPDARGLTAALIEQARVIPDFRHPDIVRIGLAPLTTSFVEVWDGLDRIRLTARR
jgi:kynureninase